MALISCNLCGNKISSRAKSCPKCGCPVLSKAAPASQINENCADCIKDKKDGEIYCNLCAHSGANTVDQTTVAAEKTTGTSETENPSDLIGKDNYSNELFSLIDAAKIKKVVIGIPFFDTDDSRLKLFRTFNKSDAITSYAALCLGPLYYLQKGLWQKGAVLTAVSAAAISVIISIESILLKSVSIMFLLMIFILSSCMFKYDLYRKQVRKESFWW